MRVSPSEDLIMIAGTGISNGRAVAICLAHSGWFDVASVKHGSGPIFSAQILGSTETLHARVEDVTAVRVR